MKAIAALVWVLHASLAMPVTPLKKADFNVLKRKTRSTDGTIACLHMQSFPGELTYTSDGNPDVCGLYLIGQPDQIVEIEFIEFNVQCETGGVLATFDGWELQGELFPGPFEHQLSMEERYQQYCSGVGQRRPHKLFASSQNAALIQFMIPHPGEGFKVMVNFKTTPQPCNAVSMFAEGVLTLKNYGLRSNCTVSIIYPETIDVLNVDVGVTSERNAQMPDAETGLQDSQCMTYPGGDYVQLLNGQGLDTSVMRHRGLFCGLESNTDKIPRMVLGCQHSVVRLVSSGAYYNTITFQYSPPIPEDIRPEDVVC